MRHAPFFGWIKDLAAPDPTTVFNLFGLIPWDPTIVPIIGSFLHLGAWPLIMGVTMFLQMRMNPTPPDPTQAMIFNWMPLVFMFQADRLPCLSRKRGDLVRAALEIRFFIDAQDDLGSFRASRRCFLSLYPPRHSCTGLFVQLDLYD